jgi:hypothetical protein
MILTYQAKQASFRCEKLQASQRRLLSLACLLISKSAYIRTDVALIFHTSNDIIVVVMVAFADTIASKKKVSEHTTSSSFVQRGEKA